MKWYKKCMSFLVRQYRLHSVKTHRKRRYLKGIIVNQFQKIEKKGMLIFEWKDWQYSFLKYINEVDIKELCYFEELLKGFFDEPIEKIIESKNYFDFSSAVVICPTKNDLVYLRSLIPYYRAMGVNNFVFIDNLSADGSLEFLKEQKDVTVFEASYDFTGRKKVGWKLQTIAQMGLNHWYIWIDSDEFLVFPHMEKYTIDEYINRLEKKKIDYVRGFMLDMYPKYSMMDGEHSDNDFLNDYKYYDKENEFYSFDKNRKVLVGGMRKRVMNISSMKLDKIPIMFCKKGLFFSGNHTISSRTRQLTGNFGCVLKHYKFLPSDYKKYKEIADKDGGGYFSADVQRQYVIAKEENKLKPYNEMSKEFKTSLDILDFSFVSDWLEDLE